MINEEALASCFHFEAGFHRANWPAIGRWLDASVSPMDLEAAYNEAALLWVTKLRADLGGDYFVLQSDQAILLCDQPMAQARWLLSYSGHIAATIKHLLGHVAWAGALGRDVLLLFSDEDDYYQYLSHHSPDGEQAGSGGVCIHSGYTHIAIPWRGDLDGAANAIVHELTHDCLAHLPLPLWLNEGIAVTVQKAIAPPESGVTQNDYSRLYISMMSWRPPLMWDELAERHFAFWTEENIQTFWAGTSFFIAGESNELSYSLAEVLVKLLAERGTAAGFQALLLAAQPDDAGQSAMLDIFNTDLGDLAGTFLGEGNWRPVRKAMVRCWEAAGWNINNDELR
ncbi:MAG: hypothetical protein KIS67_05435 [Verrucomicrobiae bacterium]|nr:hypothetical protein [Verrucomicrobiae bacterium]